LHGVWGVPGRKWETFLDCKAPGYIVLSDYF
jgi:hypothetical protein